MKPDNSESIRDLRIVIPTIKEYYTREEIEHLYPDMNILSVYEKGIENERNMFIAAAYPVILTSQEMHKVSDIKAELRREGYRSITLHGVDTLNTTNSQFYS